MAGLEYKFRADKGQMIVLVKSQGQESYGSVDTVIGHVVRFTDKTVRLSQQSDSQTSLHTNPFLGRGDRTYALRNFTEYFIVDKDRNVSAFKGR